MISVSLCLISVTICKTKTKNIYNEKKSRLDVRQLFVSSQFLNIIYLFKSTFCVHWKNTAVYNIYICIYTHSYPCPKYDFFVILTASVLWRLSSKGLARVWICSTFNLGEKIMFKSHFFLPVVKVSESHILFSLRIHVNWSCTNWSHWSVIWEVKHPPEVL